MHTEDLEAFIRSKGIPSSDVIIYHKHKEIFRFINGTKDSEGKIPLKGDELYFLYSSTKPITCVAAMRLVEKGIIGIEDPVYKYIPEYEHLSYKDGDSVKDCKNVMTVRHLFTMRGGLSYDLDMPSIKECIKNNPNADTLEIVKSFVKEPLLFEPGTNYQYSLCHDVLAAVIEVATNMKFGEFLKKEIFEPLGMTRTGFKVTPELLTQFAAQYNYENGTYHQVPTTCRFNFTKYYESGGAGIYSCVDDYVKFADAMANKGTAANGYQLLKPETVDLMRVNQIEINPNSTWPVDPGLGYGFGMRVMIDKRLAESDAPTEFEFGWCGAAGTYVSMDTYHGLTSVYAQHVLNHSWIYTDVHPVIRDTAYYLAGIS